MEVLDCRRGGADAESVKGKGKGERNKSEVTTFEAMLSGREGMVGKEKG